MHGYGNTRWLCKQIQRGDLRQQPTLDERHVAHGPERADHTIRTCHGEQHFSRERAECLSPFDGPEVSEEARTPRECGAIHTGWRLELQQSSAQSTAACAKPLLSKKRICRGIGGRGLRIG